MNAGLMLIKSAALVAELDPGLLPFTPRIKWQSDYGGRGPKNTYFKA